MRSGVIPIKSYMAVLNIEESLDGLLGDEYFEKGD